MRGYFTQAAISIFTAGFVAQATAQEKVASLGATQPPVRSAISRPPFPKIDPHFPIITGFQQDPALLQIEMTDPDGVLNRLECGYKPKGKKLTLVPELDSLSSELEEENGSAHLKAFQMLGSVLVGYTTKIIEDGSKQSTYNLVVGGKRIAKTCGNDEERGWPVDCRPADPFLSIETIKTNIDKTHRLCRDAFKDFKLRIFIPPRREHRVYREEVGKLIRDSRAVLQALMQ